jgi:hypothetical protein
MIANNNISIDILKNLELKHPLVQMSSCANDLGKNVQNNVPNAKSHGTGH